MAPPNQAPQVPAPCLPCLPCLQQNSEPCMHYDCLDIAVLYMHTRYHLTYSVYLVRLVLPKPPHGAAVTWLAYASSPSSASGCLPAPSLFGLFRPRASSRAIHACAPNTLFPMRNTTDTHLH